jgi:hypothetical protein
VFLTLQVVGTWYVLAIICSSWNRVPLCDRVDLQGNSSMLHETWTSLDLLADPRHRHGAVYSTDLAVVQPGCWRDLSPERGSLNVKLNPWIQGQICVMAGVYCAYIQGIR